MSFYRKLRDWRTIFIPVPGEGQSWDEPVFGYGAMCCGIPRT